MAFLLSDILRPARLEEAVLTMSIKKQRGFVPQHVAIILDGNRRWAIKKASSRRFGHIVGADRAEEVLDWCHEIGIKVITLYILSTENISERSPEELNELFLLFYERFSKLLSDERLTKFKIRVKALGPKLYRVRDALQMAILLEL